MLETHFVGKITRRGKTLTPPHPPAGTENLHFKLNGETRRAARTLDAHAQTAWEDMDKVSFPVPRYSHRQHWAKAA
jgi:hypothetical protein